MSTQALTADAAVTDGVTYVSSATAGTIKASLDSTVDAGDVIRFQSTAASAQILVCDEDEAAIGIVGPYESAVVTKHTDGTFLFQKLAAAPATLVANGSDLTTTQTLANAMKVILQNVGLMKAE